jgi:hypothetical protein
MEWDILCNFDDLDDVSAEQLSRAEELYSRCLLIECEIGLVINPMRRAERQLLTKKYENLFS